MFPLHTNYHDDQTATQVARAFGALRLAFEQIKSHYERLISNKYAPLPDADSVAFPYMDYYTKDGNRVQFTYQARFSNEKLIFIAKTSDGAKLFIKFTRKYSVDAHRYCSDKGFAPRLHAVEKLPGGWLMVVMDHLVLPYELVSDLPLDPKLAARLRNAVVQLHNGGFVHGDIRAVNLMAYRNGDQEQGGVMILDFDWAGADGTAKYPANVNTISIWRPEAAIDGKPIMKSHDLAMLEQILAEVPKSV